MEIILGEFYSRDQIESLSKELKDSNTSWSWTFGYNDLDKLLYYKIGSFEFKETRDKQNSGLYCCIKTPEKSLDQEKINHFTTSLHRPESKKTAAYYKRWDNQSREARKLQSKRS
jgi:hypothetical protein